MEWAKARPVGEGLEVNGPDGNLLLLICFRPKCGKRDGARRGATTGAMWRCRTPVSDREKLVGWGCSRLTVLVKKVPEPHHHQNPSNDHDKSSGQTK